jgi:TonB family protein
MKILISLLFLALIEAVVAQQQTPRTYRINGVAKTTSGAVIPGLSFGVEKDGAPYRRADGFLVGAASDINGEFVFELPAGNYKVTANGIPEDQFRLFLTLTEQGPIPDKLSLALNSTALCSEDLTVPSYSNAPLPKYPPAAIAVRAAGTVTVEAEIAPSGTVTNATALSGHPLLRAASANAVKGFQFEPTDTNVQRKSILQFIFVPSGVKREGVERFECKSRFLVVGEPATLEISETKATR